MFDLVGLEWVRRRRQQLATVCVCMCTERARTIKPVSKTRLQDLERTQR